MPLLPSGLWVPTLSPKQLAVYQCNDRYQFLCGPRLTAKTTAALHRLIRHAWETPGARIAMFAKTTKSGKQGVWSDIQWCLQEWFRDGVAGEDGEPIQFTVQPKIDGATRMHYFRLLNCYGGESEVQLHSLDCDDDIEAKLLNTRFSCIYFAELQNFESRAIFDLSIQQLRMYGLHYDQHLWISDSNPPEEGVGHFAYQIWFEERTMEEFPEYCLTEADRLMFRRRQKELRLWEFEFKDNPFLDPQQLADLKATYAHDPEKYNRFILGLWTKGNATRRIFTAFRPDHHVVGNCLSEDEDQWEYLNPVPSCSTLFTGWDTGQTNHAAVILQKRFNDLGKVCWDVLDEVISLGERMFLWDFAALVADKMDALEELCGKKDLMQWISWGDNSLEKFSSSSPQNEAAIVENVCGPRVQIQFAHEAKAPFSVPKRVQLLQILLAEDRIRISAHCVETIAMFRYVNKPRSLRINRKSLAMIAPDDPRKHVFDALSYPIYSEMMDEAAAIESARVHHRPAPSRIIGIPL